MALQPLLLDALGTACRRWAKLRCKMMKDISPLVWQEILLALILCTQSVDPTQSAPILKGAPQLLKVVDVPLKPLASKPPQDAPPAKSSAGTQPSS